LGFALAFAFTQPQTQKHPSHGRLSIRRTAHSFLCIRRLVALGSEGTDDERHARRTAFRGCRRTAFPPHTRSRQARRPLRRPVPHHRHHPRQLHQLRPPPRLHPHPVQS